MMPPDPERRARADEQLAERTFFDVVFAISWGILGRVGLPEADRDDIAQEAAMVAFRRPPPFGADTPEFERWISGVALNLRRNLLRARRRRPVVPLDDVAESADKSPSPEDNLSHLEYADHLLAGLPENERRAVTLYEKEALTFEEIAEREGIGATTARARYRRGLALLRAAAARCEAEGVVIPIPLGSDPPPEVVERAWQRFRAQLDAMEGEPPPSGTRRVEPSSRDDRPPSGNARRRHLSKLLRLVPFAGLLVGATLYPDRTRDERPEVAAALIASATPAEPAPSPEAAPTVSPEAAPTVSPEAAPTRARVPAHRDRPHERAALRQAHAALAAGNLEEALSALADDARRFPGGGGATQRDGLLAQACARYRRTHAQSDPRCSGRP
jgi:RNA polymerase sigma-70 factor (ECF subfamily)